MKRFSLLLCFLVQSVPALGDVQCKDLLVHFVDESAAGNDASEVLQRRKLSALIPCSSDGLGRFGGLPTVIHFMENDGHRLCVTERTCGNVESWNGYFELSAGWTGLTLFRDASVFAKAAGFASDWNGFQLVATFALNHGQIERDCSTLRPPSCVEPASHPKNDDLSWK